MVTSSKKAYATHCMTQATAARASTLQQATADLYLYRRVKHRSGSVSVGSLDPGAHKVLFEPSRHLWWVWGLIVNMVTPLLPSFWGFSFALGHGVSFFGPTFSCRCLFSSKLMSTCPSTPPSSQGTAEAKGISQKEGGKGAKSQQSPWVGAGMPVRKRRHFLQCPHL